MLGEFIASILLTPAYRITVSTLHQPTFAIICPMLAPLLRKSCAALIRVECPLIRFGFRLPLTTSDLKTRFICPGSIDWFNRFPKISLSKKPSLMPAYFIHALIALVGSISNASKTPSRVWSVFDWRSGIRSFPSPHNVKFFTLSEVSSEHLRSAVRARRRIILSLVLRKSSLQTCSIFPVRAC